jgi:hypothetical protein
MSAAAGGAYYTLFYFDGFLALLLLLIICFLLFCCFFGLAEYSEVSALTLQLDEDPLLAAVGLLEANWISV